MNDIDFYEITKERLKERVNPMVYTVWISPLNMTLSNGVLTINSSSKLRTDVVKNEFGKMIEELVKELLAENIEIIYTTSSDSESVDAEVSETVEENTTYETDILQAALKYIKECYKFTTVDPYVFNLLFKDLKVEKVEGNTIWLDVEHRLIADILQEKFSTELYEAFSEAIEDEAFIEYTVAGDNYSET